MGKRSHKQSRYVGCEKSGCMWSFVSMFDLRYGRVAPKMLLDRRYETCHHVGTGNQKNMHNMKLNVDGNDQDGEENVVVKRRPSVKELIEEDLLSELLSKSDTMSAEVGFISERNRVRAGKTTRSRRKGSEQQVSAELPCPRNSEDVGDHPEEELCGKQRSLLRKNSDKLANLNLETDQHSKPPVGSNVAEQEICDSKQANEKQHKFFWRKSKSFDKNVSNGNMLKPRSETNKGGLERSSSHFSFTEIKRKLKMAMGKEQLEGGDGRRLRENGGRSFSGKERVTIAEPAMSFRKVENDATRPIECCNKGKECQVTNLSKPGESNIYFEADKHITDMLSNGLTTQEVKTNANPLCRILSFPDYNSSSVGSSGIDLWYGFLPARMSFPNMETFQRLESHLGRISLSSELSDEDHKAVLQVPSEPVSNEPIDDGEEMNVDAMTTEGGSEIELSSQIVASEEINLRPEQVTVHYASGTSNCSDAICPRSEDSDLFEHESSPSTSKSTSSVTNNICQLDLGSKELSPISVIEEISPESTTSHPVTPPRIQFEEIGLKSGTEDAKHCIVEFIENVVASSGLKWEELSDSPDQILDPSSCHEMELHPNQLCDDKQLLFDCIDEVLVEVYDCKYLSCHPGLSRRIRPVVLDVDNTIREVWERVRWHLMPFPVPHSLEQIVERDMMDNKDSTISWKELGRDSQTVLVEISDAIFEDVIEGIIRSCVNKCERKWRICR